MYEKVSYEIVERIVKEIKSNYKYYNLRQFRTLYRLFLTSFENNSYYCNSKEEALKVPLPNKMPLDGAMNLAMAKFNYYCIRKEWSTSTQVFSTILKRMPVPNIGKEQDYYNWLLMLEAIIMELHNIE